MAAFRRPALSRRPAVRVMALFGGGGGGGGNPFDMKNLMESVKKAQGMVQQETARVQAELARQAVKTVDCVAQLMCLSQPLARRKGKPLKPVIVPFAARSLRGTTRMKLCG